jgi:hypothetical protein
LRRIVEEAALAGIPAIVIDLNNDLSRLGDAWPERPVGFTDEDEAKVKRYAATVEVVVWTPGVHAGNPLFLSVLPDFAAVGDDPDERAQAVTMAADTLGPLAGAKTNLQKGVLADALRAFANKRGGDLKAMTALLADLPEGVSEIGNADKLGAKMADELKAAVATNPLLKATGPGARSQAPVLRQGFIEDTSLGHQSFWLGVGRGQGGLRQPAADDAVRLGKETSLAARAALRD